MVKKSSGLRVCVRFRPMNGVEKEQPGNQICIKISACRRAVRITDPRKPEHPSLFHFDQIYPPGVTQMDVHNFTGAPLVEGCMEGYNSTLFAYGQTGSGKTFSMMGVLNTENRGLMPRIIEDIFKKIESLPEDNTDQYTVQIMMCEIYMEKVKDLFNSVNDNLRIRQNQKGAIYVEGITEVYCACTEEILDNMDNGFLNRATSSTRMNNESSRSHCVVMIRVRRTTKAGSVQECMCKMVDLAGSEKTKKTMATGDRLQEAKAINKSLTTLGRVMAGLTGKGLVPYRESKLTMLLQDALGGNSRTSLIVAASPCSYNVEETISALRFGKRAKKVKNNAVINEDLTVDEYKKKVAKLEARLSILERQNKLMKLQLDACQQWIESNGGDFIELLRSVKIAEDTGDAEETPDVDFENAEEVSSEAYVIDKATGDVAVGKGFAVGIKATPDDIREAEDRARREIENAAVDKIVAEQYPTRVGGASSEELQEAFDEVADLKAELRGSENMCGELEERCIELEDQLANAIDEIKIQTVSVYQYKMYKAKSEFLEKESTFHLQRLQNEIVRLSEKADLVATPTDEDAAKLDELLNAEGASVELVQKLKDRLLSMSRSQARERKELAKLKETGLCLDPEILKSLEMGGGATKKALMQIMKRFRDANVKLSQVKEENFHLHKAAMESQKREEYHIQMRNNWRGQLQHMEEAVMLCSQIHSKERKQYEKKIMEANTTVKTLKDWVTKIKSRNARRNRTALGSRIRVPGEGNSTVKAVRKLKPGHKVVKRRKRSSYDLTDKARQIAALRH